MNTSICMSGWHLAMLCFSCLLWGAILGYLDGVRTTLKAYDKAVKKAGLR